ncbi:unnamed protein product [Heterosigma akashiwo]
MNCNTSTTAMHEEEVAPSAAILSTTCLKGSGHHWNQASSSAQKTTRGVLELVATTPPTHAVSLATAKMNFAKLLTVAPEVWPRATMFQV